MSGLIKSITVVMCAIPVAFVVGALAGAPFLWIPATLVALLIAAVWLFARPQRFEAHGGAIDIVFPTWRRTIADVASARRHDARELRATYGFLTRIGVGGLWGGFGWLWSPRGTIEFYVSRTDGFVLVERRGGRPLLVTPDDPAAFVAALNGPAEP
jgi:hypothetical protein